MYRVKTYSVGGKGNKIYYSGDVVSENNVINADELVKKGFLEPITRPAKVETSKPIKVIVEKPKEFNDISVKELKSHLGSFPDKAKKPELYDLYVATFE